MENNTLRFTIVGDVEGFQVSMNVYDEDIEQLEAGQNPFVFEPGIVQYAIGVATDNGVGPFRAKGPTSAPVNTQAGIPTSVWSCPVHPNAESGLSFYADRQTGQKYTECKYKERYQPGTPIPQWGKVKADGSPVLDRNGYIWCKYNALG